METGGHVHDAGEDVLYIGHPQVQGPGTQDQLGPHGIGQRGDITELGQGRMAGAADPVEPDGRGPRRPGLSDQVRASRGLKAARSDCD